MLCAKRRARGLEVLRRDNELGVGSSMRMGKNRPFNPNQPSVQTTAPRSATSIVGSNGEKVPAAKSSKLHQPAENHHYDGVVETQRAGAKGKKAMCVGRVEGTKPVIEACRYGWCTVCSNVWGYYNRTTVERRRMSVIPPATTLSPSSQNARAKRQCRVIRQAVWGVGQAGSACVCARL